MHILWLALVGVVAALTESDAGVVDWHKRLVGVPLTTFPSTAPVFHRVGTKNTKSVILTATEQNILAALNPVDGSIGALYALIREEHKLKLCPEWRHVYQPEDPILAFEKHGDSTFCNQYLSIRQ